MLVRICETSNRKIKYTPNKIINLFSLGLLKKTVKKFKYYDINDYMKFKIYKKTVSHAKRTTNNLFKLKIIKTERIITVKIYIYIYFEFPDSVA